MQGADIPFYPIAALFERRRHRGVSVPSRILGELLHEGAAFFERAQCRPERTLDRFALTGIHRIDGIPVADATAKSQCPGIVDLVQRAVTVGTREMRRRP